LPQRGDNWQPATSASSADGDGELGVVTGWGKASRAEEGGGQVRRAVEALLEGLRAPFRSHRNRGLLTASAAEFRAWVATGEARAAARAAGAGAEAGAEANGAGARVADSESHLVEVVCATAPGSVDSFLRYYERKKALRG